MCSLKNSRRWLITPLIKKASIPSDDLQYYIPLSGLCFMSKLVEWLVVKQLMQHIYSNNLENPRQSTSCRPMASNYQLSHLRPCWGSNPGLRGGRRECYHSATVAPLFCLIVVEDIVQDTTVQIKVCWRFLNSVNLYINQKNTLAIDLLLMLPWFGIICLMGSILPQVSPISEKG